MSILKKGDLVVDLSKWNGDVDFSKLVAFGVKAVILKATEGATVLDPWFYKNVKKAVAAGLPWTAYHFATWNSENEVEDATEEATFFRSVVMGAESYNPLLPLVLDIESNKPIPYTKQEMVDYVGAFAANLSKFGWECAIYASPGFLNQYLPADHPFTGLKLWAADFTGAINPVPGWKSIWLHQYTESGEIPGLSGKFDFNKVL